MDKPIEIPFDVDDGKAQSTLEKILALLDKIVNNSKDLKLSIDTQGIEEAIQTIQEIIEEFTFLDKETSKSFLEVHGLEDIKTQVTSITEAFGEMQKTLKNIEAGTGKSLGRPVQEIKDDIDETKQRLERIKALREEIVSAKGVSSGTSLIKQFGQGEYNPKRIQKYLDSLQEFVQLGGRLQDLQYKTKVRVGDVSGESSLEPIEKSANQLLNDIAKANESSKLGLDQMLTNIKDNTHSAEKELHDFYKELAQTREVNSLQNLDRTLETVKGSLTSLADSFSKDGLSSLNTQLESSMKSLESLSKSFDALNQSFNNIEFLKTIQEGGKPIEITIDTGKAEQNLDNLTQKMEALVQEPTQILLSIQTTGEVISQLNQIKDLAKQVSDALNNINKTRTPAAIEDDVKTYTKAYKGYEDIVKQLSGASKKGGGQSALSAVLGKEGNLSAYTAKVDEIQDYINLLAKYKKNGGDLSQEFDFKYKNPVKEGMQTYTTDLQHMIDTLRELKETNDAYKNLDFKVFDETQNKKSKSFFENMESVKQSLTGFQEELTKAVNIKEGQNAFVQIGNAAETLSKTFTEMQSTGGFEKLFNFGNAASSIQDIVNALSTLSSTLSNIFTLMDHTKSEVSRFSKLEYLQKNGIKTNQVMETNQKPDGVKIKIQSNEAGATSAAVLGSIGTSAKQAEQQMNQFEATAQNALGKVGQAAGEANSKTKELGDSIQQATKNQSPTQPNNNQPEKPIDIKVNISDAQEKLEQLKTLITSLTSTNAQITINAVTDAMFESLESISMILESMQQYTYMVQINVATDTAIEQINGLITILDTLKDPRTITIDVKPTSTNAVQTAEGGVQPDGQVQPQLEQQIKNIQQQIDSLKAMKENLNTLIGEINEIPPITNTFDSSSLLTNLNNLAIAMKGLPEGGITAKLIGNLNTEEISGKIVDLAAAFEILYEQIAKFAGTGEGANTFTGVMDSLNQLMSNADNLKNLADVLKASDDKINKVKEATKTKEEKEQEAARLDEQKAKYKELSDAVKQYVSDREELAKGNKQGTVSNDSLKQQAQDIASLAKELRENEQLYNQKMQQAAIAPLTNLKANMDQLKQQTIETQSLAEARKALADADKFYEKNGSLYSGNENLEKLKASADEVRNIIQQATTEGNGSPELFNNLNAKAQELKTNLTDVTAEIKALEATQRVASRQELKGTGIQAAYGQAQSFLARNIHLKTEGGGTTLDTALDALREKLKEADAELSKLGNKPVGETARNDITKIADELSKLQNEAQNALPVDPTKKNGYLANFNAWVDRNGAAYEKYHTQIDYFREQLQNVDSIGAFNNLTSQIENFKAGIIQAGDAGRSFGQKLTSTFESLGRYLMTYVSFYRIIGTIKQGIGIVKELDSAMKDIKMVSQETEATYEKMQKASFNIADSIGSDATTIQKSMGTWLRLGKSIEESQEAAKASAWLVNVSEFDNIDEASKSLVSIKQAYDDLDYTNILDKLNAVGERKEIAQIKHQLYLLLAII